MDDSVRIISPACSGGCLYVSFEYHMYGVAMGTLSILSVTSGRESEVWSLSGNQANQWHSTVVRLPFGTERIIFQGNAGNSYTSDMAIDDISEFLQYCLYISKIALHIVSMVLCSVYV